VQQITSRQEQEQQQRTTHTHAAKNQHIPHPNAKTGTILATYKHPESKSIHTKDKNAPQLCSKTFAKRDVEYYPPPHPHPRYHY
jgi:hypothetical protein